LIRLLSNADNVTQTADDLWREKSKAVIGRRGGGRRAVLNALAELRRVGYIQTFVFQTPGGFFATRNIVYDTAQQAPEGWTTDCNGILRGGDSTQLPDFVVGADDDHSQVIDKTEVRLPTSGSPTFGGRTPIETPRAQPKEKQQQQHALARAPAYAGAAAAKAEKVKQNKALRIVHGIHCWSEDDTHTAEALVATHGLEAVQRAVAAIIVLGHIPLPGRVALELQRLAGEAQAACRERLAADRLAQLEAASRARAEAEMAELMSGTTPFWGGAAPPGGAGK
jgi:hypothetical protein